MRIKERLNELEKDVARLQWQLENPPKYKYGDSITFNKKKCKVLDYKPHFLTYTNEYEYLLDNGEEIFWTFI